MGSVRPNPERFGDKQPRTAEAAGLALVEVAVAPVRRGRAIVLVEPLVRLDRFLAQARERILDLLVGLPHRRADRRAQGRGGDAMILVAGGLADNVTELVTRLRPSRRL